MFTNLAIPNWGTTLWECHPSLGAGELPLRTAKTHVTCARGDVPQANSASGEWSSRHVPMQASIWTGTTVVTIKVYQWEWCIHLGQLRTAAYQASPWNTLPISIRKRLSTQQTTSRWCCQRCCRDPGSHHFLGLARLTLGTQWKAGFNMIHTQMIHVWYIYLHVPHKWPKCR